MNAPAQATARNTAKKTSVTQRDTRRPRSSSLEFFASSCLPLPKDSETLSNRAQIGVATPLTPASPRVI